MAGAELEEATTPNGLASTMNEESTTISAVRMVVQRYRYARLLINETQVVTVGEPSDLILSNNQNQSSNASAGVLVYISFARTATEAKVTQAAKTILNLPILTMGAWGDGEDTKNILQLATERYYAKSSYQTNAGSSSSLSLLVVPQANLTAKVKKLGKSIQYRDQISKTQGEQLFQHFVKTLETLIEEHAHSLVGNASTVPNPRILGSNNNNNNNKPSKNTLDPSIPPSQLFHQDSTYGSFEEGNYQTFPMTYANGEPLTKSARKKLQKIYNAHVIRHSKYLANRANNTVTEEASTGSGEDLPTTAPSTKVEMDNSSVDPPSPQPLLIPSLQLIQLVAGTFGKRQGLEIQSDMGPFCHVVEIN